MIEYEQFNCSNYGTIRRHQLQMLMGIASMQQNVGTHALEFGTFTGATTNNIARMLPRHIVFTCSLPVGLKPMLNEAQSDLSFSQYEVEFAADVKNRIVHFKCDSAILGLPENTRLGFVFIDGAHSSDYVLNDFQKCLPFLVSGAVVVFHDYGMDCCDGITSVKETVDSIMERFSNWTWIHWKENSLIWGVKP